MLLFWTLNDKLDFFFFCGKRESWLFGVFCRLSMAMGLLDMSSEWLTGYRVCSQIKKKKMLAYAGNLR